MEELVKMPKTQRGMATLNKIVRAAELTFGKKGYHGSSINDIANKAKVAPGTLYIYFPDKLSLYCHLLNQYNHKIRMRIAKRCKGLTDRREIERVGLLAFLEIIRDCPYMYNIIWESLYIDKRLFVDYYETFAQHYVRQIDSGKIRGQIRDDIDSTALAYMLMGITNFIGLRYVMFYKSNFDIEEISYEVLKMLDRGMFLPGNGNAEEAEPPQMEEKEED